MKQREIPRRKLIRKISSAKLKDQPELCVRWVWALRESGRSDCPVPSCVMIKKGWPLPPR